MRCLISGGTGLLGSLLTEDLLAGGHQVSVLTRRAGDPSRTGLRHIVWDGRTAGSWWREVADCNIWVHLAGDNLGAGRWTRAKKARILASRLESGAALVEAADRLGGQPRVLVQASAVGFYGSTGDQAVDETAAAGQGFLAGVVTQWERSTADLETRGWRRVLLRTGVVLSSRGGALPRLALPFRLLVGGTLGSGRQWVPWIHQRDQVRATRFLIARDDARGPFNLVAPEVVTQAAFGRSLGQVLGRPSAFRVPESILRLALGEMSAVVLEGQRALPERLLRCGFQFEHPDLSEALSNLFRSEP